MKFLIILLFPILLQASLVPNDYQYYKVDEEAFSLYFDEKSEEFARGSRASLFRLINFYEKSFNFSLETPPNIVFASEKNQIANAFATSGLGYLNFYYRGGVLLLDEFAIKSWKFTLLTHEMVHLYQLGAKQGIPRTLQKIFGQPYEPHIFYIVPIFTNPNQLLPTWLVEGNAVLNESIWKNGGRLFSGEEWALFNALMKSGKMNNERFVNNHIYFPYGAEKYNVGAHFAYFLSKKFGLDRTNQFFLAHGDNYINPFLVNGPFYRHFGETYYELVDQFVFESRKTAEKQKDLVGVTISTSLFDNPISSDAEDIFTLQSGSGTTPPTLIRVNKANSKLIKKESDLPMGRVIKKDGEFYVARAGATKLTAYEYSLWKNRDSDLSEYRGKALLSNDLYVDTKNSFDQPIIYQKDKKLGEMESLPISDTQGNIYTFKQEDKRRTLSVNGNPLTSFTGYYGKLCEVYNNLVTFIAPTEFGSTLFAFDLEKKITYRLSSADTITDARLINESELIAQTVNFSSYKLIRGSVEKIEETPFELGYNFEKETPPSVMTTMQFNEKEEATLFNSLRYTGMPIVITATSGKWMTSLKPTFADPLLYHTIYGNYVKDNYNNEEKASLLYTNGRYLLNYMGGLFYEKNEVSLGAGLQSTFYKNGSWHFNFYELALLDEDDDFGNYFSLGAKSTLSFPLNFYPYQKISINLETTRDEYEKAHAANISSFITAPKDVSLFFDSTYKVSDASSFIAGKPISESIESNSTYPTDLNYFSRENRESLRIGASLSKPIETPLYFEIFPVSLMRIAPKIIGNYYKLDRGSKYSTDFFEKGYGVLFELLLIHLAPVRFEWSTFDRKGEDGSVISFMFKDNF